ncbi:hypothetical protein DQG23_21765 [Paenibacillus contaminans]|uniref:Uncharacterized protein n=1 Tax=Paenibacillus contaminans TaxID=450362 RepID=A0A329MGY4_9BACL|nr:hypothetical protein DQG23_21765 [Paenibacillus contaminans]
MKAQPVLRHFSQKCLRSVFSEFLYEAAGCLQTFHTAQEADADDNSSLCSETPRAEAAVRFDPFRIESGYPTAPAVRKNLFTTAIWLGTPVKPFSKQGISDYSVRGTSIPCSKWAYSDNTEGAQ